MAYERDPNHWLKKWSPKEWIQASLAELHRAEARIRARDLTAGLAGCKRAAGMALNGALLVEPNESWGRSFVDHVSALARDETVPERVREACRVLVSSRPPASDILQLRSRRTDEELLEAARDVMAHAYAIVQRHESVEGTT
jgi:HEPN domain-containing protein